jgi:hypothetical protein
MNWGFVVSTLIIAAAIWQAAREIIRFQQNAEKARHVQAIARIAAVLIAGRLSDKEYFDRVEKLRISVDVGKQIYPGSPEAVKMWEIEREMLEEIDYRGDNVRRSWIELASKIYQDALAKSTAP